MYAKKQYEKGEIREGLTCNISQRKKEQLDVVLYVSVETMFTH